MVHKFQNARQGKTARNTVKIQQPKRAKYFIHLPSSPYPRQNVRIPYFHTYERERESTL
jgi:hypothetical protein